MVLAFSWTFVVILETNQNFFDQGWHQAVFKAQDSEIYWEPNHVTTLFPSRDNFTNKGTHMKKKTFSLEPLAGIFQIWRLLFWFYSVAPSPGADNIWIYILYLIHYYCKQVLRTVRVSSLLSLLNDASVDQLSPEEEFTSPSFFHTTLATDNTAQKMKFPIKDFFSKCRFGHIYWNNP